MSDAEPTVLVCGGADHETMASIAAAAGVQHVLTLNADETGTVVDAAAAQQGMTAVARGADDWRQSSTPPALPGSIEVRGPNVFGGYWRNDAKTAETFRDDGFFVTDDLGRYDAGGYLCIVVCDKDLTISGGLNIYRPRSRPKSRPLTGWANPP